MFFDEYVKLCKKAGKSPSGAAQDMGLSRARVTDWKRGGLPSATALRKIAEYFGVSVNDLLGIEKDPDDAVGVNSEIEAIFNSLNADHQQQALAFLRFLIDTENTEK